MRIMHRIAINASPDDRRELAELGIRISEGWIAFDVDDSDPNWPALREWVERRRAPYSTSTTFSPEEIAQASWVKLDPTWHWGYPQPESAFRYKSVTYDLSAYCPDCGIGKVQKAPFRMKGEPKWGRKGILQLNWVFDEYFAKLDVWRTIFEPLEVACRPVLDIKGNQLNTVVQLVAAEDEVEATLDGYPAETCTTCGRVKYLPVVRGQFPPLRTVPQGHYVKTKQYFGSGASAQKAVLVSQSVVRALAEHKLSGVSFTTVAERE